MTVTEPARRPLVRGLARLGDRAADRSTAVFVAWSALLAAAHAVGPVAVSWHSFVQGAGVLTSDQALHLYARHAVLQIGPATYAFVIPILTLAPGRPGEVLAMLLCSAAGVLVLHQIARLVPDLNRHSRIKLLAAGLLLLTVWSQIAITYVHPDDILALLLAVVAVRLVRADQVIWAGLALGLAADCKGRALVFVPLLLAGARHRVLALAACGMTVAVAWSPFYLGDTGSLAAARFRIPNVATSSLRVLGVESPGTPSWDRPAQILLGAALAYVAVRRGRWPAVVLVGVCARLLLDPSTKSYYDVGLLVGAVLVDMLLVDTVMVGGAVPVVTISAVVLFVAPRVVQHLDAGLYGLVRTAYLIAIVTVVLAVPRRRLTAAFRR